MRDDKALCSLRPEIPVLTTENSSPAEQFQNKTLRPILKFQHELLVLIVADLPHIASIRSQSKTLEIFKSNIIDYIKQQSEVKNQLIGLIIGHLTSTEWPIYREMKTELNKRIIQMCVERAAGAIWR